MASLYNQGNAMMQQNNHEEAAKYYKEALKLSLQILHSAKTMKLLC